MTEPTYKERAEQFAASLLQTYDAVPLTYENVRDLVAVAWLTGSMAGSEETVEVIKRELLGAA